MPLAPLPTRRSIRLNGIDYSEAGFYFVTICAHKRKMLFGSIIEDNMALNSVGELISECWTAIPRQFKGIKLGASVVMPNHLHGIVIILAKPLQPVNFSDKKRPAGFGKPVAHALSTIVRSFKGTVSRLAAVRGLVRGHPVWQRGYYERVIRTGEEYSDTSRYILENPLCWKTDAENTDSTS
jgi:REP element-mobilizing transposase RayT